MKKQKHQDGGVLTAVGEATEQVTSDAPPKPQAAGYVLPMVKALVGRVTKHTPAELPEVTVRFNRDKGKWEVKQGKKVSFHDNVILLDVSFEVQKERQTYVGCGGGGHSGRARGKLLSTNPAKSMPENTQRIGFIGSPVLKVPGTLTYRAGFYDNDVGAGYALINKADYLIMSAGGHAKMVNGRFEKGSK